MKTVIVFHERSWSVLGIMRLRFQNQLHYEYIPIFGPPFAIIIKEKYIWEGWSGGAQTRPKSLSVPAFWKAKRRSINSFWEEELFPSEWLLEINVIIFILKNRSLKLQRLNDSSKVTSQCLEDWDSNSSKHKSERKLEFPFLIEITNLRKQTKNSIRLRENRQKSLWSKGMTQVKRTGPGLGWFPEEG